VKIYTDLVQIKEFGSCNKKDLIDQKKLHENKISLGIIYTISLVVTFSYSMALTSSQKLMMSLLATNSMSRVFFLNVAGHTKEVLQARVFKLLAVAIGERRLPYQARWLGIVF
jgi:hypothetical protein